MIYGCNFDTFLAFLVFYLQLIFFILSEISDSSKLELSWGFFFASENNISQTALLVVFLLKKI